MYYGFKVMGVTVGRKESNSEILLKEALLACQEQGSEITMINLRDYNIMDCTGCTACTNGMTKGKNVGCTLDKKAIMEVMLNQDAVIFSAPTYDLMPTATFFKFMHRSLSYESSFLEAIGHTQGGFYTDENLATVNGKFIKYKDLKFPTIEIDR